MVMMAFLSVARRALCTRTAALRSMLDTVSADTWCRQQSHRSSSYDLRPRLRLKLLLCLCHPCFTSKNVLPETETKTRCHQTWQV